MNIFNIELSKPGKLLLLLAGIAIVLGAWYLVTGILPLAFKKTRKTIKQYDSVGKSKRQTSVNSLDDSMQNLSKRFVKYIKLDKIERSEKEKALRISNMGQTPEEYMAYMLTVSAIFGGIGVFFLIIGIISKIFVINVIGAGMIFMGFMSYYYNNAKLKSNQKKSIAGIECELARFVSFINMNLAQNNESILSMLERYTPDSDAFEDELKTTIADAKTSNFDGAMARWDQRVNSDKLKQITHGLISANMGDDVTMYFAMLERDMTAYEIAYLEENVRSIPSRMRIPKILMYVALAVAMFFPLIMQIVEAFIEVFGE